MALVVKDRVKEATTTTGTGTISLDGAATGFQTFVAGIGTTNTTYYAIVDNNTGDYEVGIGTITDATPDTLSRDTILESSNAGSAVNLQAGTKDVFCTYPAEKSVYLDSSGQLILDGTAITATASELNFVDGVTSSIQTQIDSFANSLEGVKNDYVYTATASQTVFSGADDNTNTLVIDLAGLVNVFLNGVRLIRDTDYTVSAAGDSITLTTGATVNDLLEVEVFGNFTGQSGAEVGITGGLIDGVDIGNTTAGDGTFVDLTATGTTTLAGATTSADITFGDNDKAIFGAGSDLQIYHDGSNSYIAETGTGNLKILGDNIYLKNSADTETALRYIPSGEIRLYYANAEKLTTTNTGIDVTGTVTADGLTVDTDGIVYDSGNVGIGATSPDIFSFGSTYKAFAVQNTTSNGNNVQYLTADGTGSSTLQWTNQTYRRAAITDDSSSNLKFSTNGSNSSSTGITERMRINSNGDISFYEDTGATPKLFWDASAERLGLGTTVPSHNIDVTSSQTASLRLESTTYGADFILYSGATGADKFGIYDADASAYRFIIDNAGNVGIGTSSPSQKFHVYQSETNSQAYGVIQNNRSRNAGLLTQTTNGGFYTGTSIGTDALCWQVYDMTNGERMRIDSSGNLLVGQITSTAPASGNVIGAAISPLGYISTNRTGVAAEFGTRSDGDIAVFRKDGTAVGAIGTRAGYLKIGSADTGLLFNSGGDTIYPENPSTGALRDAAIDLGTGVSRFKDFYLSGGVYFGGSGSANHLDDYEEGTFNPTISSGISGVAFSAQSGAYTKVGNLVSFAFRINLSAGTGNSNRVEIGGLPFTSSTTVSGSNGVATLAYSSAVFDTTEATTFYIAGNATRIEFYNRDGASFIGTQINTPASFNVNLVGFYYTAS